jgi:mannose-6-phosphate isomerase-like protein (cupin superfamily)
MPNLPIWVYVLALIALLVLALGGMFRSPHSKPQLEPQVIPIAQILAQFPSDSAAVTAAPLAEFATGTLAAMRIETATPAHYHRTGHEMVYVLRGYGKAISAGEEFQLVAGKMLIVFAGTPILLQREGAEPLDLLTFSTPPSPEDDLVLLEHPEEQTPAGALKPMIVDVEARMAQELDQRSRGLELTMVAEVKPTGSVALARVSERIPLHHHPKENHFIYVLKGRAQGTLGSLSVELSPAQMVIVPAGVQHRFERLGDEPFVFILFSTPPFVESDIVWD